jgi:ActR/RegA family two-component response regulator
MIAIIGDDEQFRDALQRSLQSAGVSVTIIRMCRGCFDSHAFFLWEPE